MLRRWKEVAELLALESIGKTAIFAKINSPVVIFDECKNLSLLEEILPMPENLAELWGSSINNGDVFELVSKGVNAVGIPFIIASINRNHGWYWQIVYFVASEAGWFPQATITLEWQKGNKPVVEYLPGRPGAILVEHITFSGTGVFQKRLSFYQIGITEAKVIFSVPTIFYVFGWGMPFGRKLELKTLVKPDNIADNSTLELGFEIEYSILYIDPYQAVPGEHDLLFTDGVYLELLWNAKEGQFMPSGPSDDCSIIDEMWNEGLLGFCLRYRERLLQLGRLGSDSQRQFVKKYVDNK